MRNIGISLLDFFIPRFCPSCNARLTPDDSCICIECLQSIKRPDTRRIRSEFHKKFGHHGIISDFTSYFIFEKDAKLQKIIHSLKYEGKFLTGIYLGTLLGETINRDFAKYNIDVLIPVPLHHIKRAERQYNQSLYIAKGIRKTTGIKICSRILKRKRYTESQTSMNLSEREKNIQGAFTIRQRSKNVNVLLIDDVITTGSTIQECGRMLLQAGAHKIYAASVAIAN